MTTDILSSILVMSRHLDIKDKGEIMTAKTTTKLAPLWAALFVLFTFHAASTGGFQQVSTYIGIAVGAAIVGVAWAVGRRRESASRHVSGE